MPEDNQRLSNLEMDVAILKNANTSLASDVTEIKNQMRTTDATVNTKLEAIQSGLANLGQAAMNSMPKWAFDSHERKNTSMNITWGLIGSLISGIIALGVVVATK